MAELTTRQRKFVEAYIKTNDAKEAVISAGYSPKSSNSIAVQAHRMLKHPAVVSALANFNADKRKELSKDSFVEKALTCFEALEVTEANKPRFLELAGKACDIIGSGQDLRPNQSLTLVNVQLSGKESPQELLANVRRLIQDNSGNA